MPDWLQSGWQIYAGRMPASIPLELQQLKTSGKQSAVDEQARMLLLHSNNSHRVALHGSGCMWSTEKLAACLAQWQQLGRDISFLIGGADGLTAEVLDHCQQSWSLGPLTFPHMLVRVLVAEQLYRAAMIMQGHPYHRA